MLGRWSDVPRRFLKRRERRGRRGILLKLLRDLGELCVYTPAALSRIKHDDDLSGYELWPMERLATSSIAPQHIERNLNSNDDPHPTDNID